MVPSFFAESWQPVRAVNRRTGKISTRMIRAVLVFIAFISYLVLSVN
jgi:hypothetical protein